jgi:16S rRNA (cytidine1402-2'-O)-methyltransferase
VVGRLVVIATPIGNLADLSPRARAALSEADLIAAEDTRHTGALLHTLGISKPLLSLHEYNENQRLPELTARLREGACIALVSDAGTPLLSDPGYLLVRTAIEAGATLVPIPGPSAITTALAVAGLPTDRFCFEGFLPARETERRQCLTLLVHEPRTLVFFESPHRIVASLVTMAEIFESQRQALVARELTKQFETLYRGTLAELAAQAQAEPNFARGELTLVVQGASKVATDYDAAQLARTVTILLQELPPGRAAALAAQLTGAPRQAAYILATQNKR